MNFFLVHRTQQVLDWLNDLGKPVDIEVANSVWLLLIPSPSERQAILDALLQHHLVELKGKTIEITAKGREYVLVRGKVSPAFPPTRKS